jgi:hypothetical protein
MEGIPPEALKRLLEQMPELAIGPSRLVGVVAVGRVVETNGVTVEILSVEIREAGALVHWRSRADRTIGLLVPTVSISDDRGTEYRASTAHGGGDERSWVGDIAITPPPERGAVLSIGIETFGVDPRMRMPGWVPGEPVDGPWLFTVDTGDIRPR